MAYRLTADESVPGGIRRIVQEEIESATRLFEKDSGSSREEAIHEARKSVKKIRAVLRLVRPELGKTYRNENARFRRAARQLSGLRDAAAILEVFNQLAKTFSETLDSESMGAIRRGLERDKSALEADSDAGKVIQKTAAALNSAGGRLKDWPPISSGFAKLAPGLQATYRSGRKALAKAEKKHTSAAYHELRKRVKDHWYHVRLLENMWTEAMQAYESNLKELETWLGDDHNLVVLRSKLEDQPKKYGGASAVESFLAIARGQQAELRKNAVSLAKQLYAEKPPVFVHKLEKLWDGWHAQPAKPRKPVAKIPTKKAVPGGKPKKTAA